MIRRFKNAIRLIVILVTGKLGKRFPKIIDDTN